MTRHLQRLVTVDEVSCHPTRASLIGMGALQPKLESDPVRWNSARF